MSCRNLKPQMQTTKVGGFASAVGQLQCEIAHHRVRGGEILHHEAVCLVCMHIDTTLSVLAMRSGVEYCKGTVSMSVVAYELPESLD